LKSALQRVAPFTDWWPRVNGVTMRADLLAGFMGAVVVLPQGIAFATLAGLPPEYGLYCAMVPTAIAALFGSSWHAISGPTNAISLVLLATLGPLIEPGTERYIHAVFTLAFLVGVTLLAMGAFRLGAVSNFISHTVVVGFSAGIGILIITSQLGSFFGLEVPRGSSFLQAWTYFVTHLGLIKPYTLVVAVVAVVAGILAQRLVKRVPYPLIAVVAAGSAAYALDTALGPDVTGIKLLGPLPGAVPRLSYPDFALDTISQLLGVTVAVTALCVAESMSVARALAAKSGQRIDPNQELLGQGLANVAASFFSGYVSCGSFNRSAANYEAGAKTPLAAVFAAAFLLVIVLAVAPLVAYLPYAAMAGVLLLIALRLINLAELKHIGRASRGEAAVLGVTLAATLLMNLEFAILFGVLLSLGIYLHRTSQPRFVQVVPNPLSETRKSVEVREGLETCPQLALIRLEGGLYFGAVDHAERQLELLRTEHPTQKHALLLCKGINYIDLAGGEVLVSEALTRRAAGGGLYLHGLRPSIRERLARGGQLAEIGEHHVFETKYQAIKYIYTKLDRELCRRCTARVFEECQAIPRNE
jgi:SulP family sulfate permease